MLPILPPEIFLHIIRLSLPPATYTAHRERYDILLIFSLVSRTWRSFAQGELFESVVLQSPREEKRLSVALDSTGVDLAVKMKSIRLRAHNAIRISDNHYGWEALVTPALRMVCFGVLEMQARQVRLRLENLADIKSLRRLHLHTVYSLTPYSHLPSSATPLFSHLEHLSLSESGFFSRGEWIDLICPSVFPALRSLLLAETLDFEVLVYMRNVLYSIGPQVTSLAIIDESEEQNLLRAMAPCWGSFTAFEHLAIHERGAIDPGDAPPDLYPLLPTRLHSLEIIASPPDRTEPQLTIHHLLLSLQVDVASLRDIKRICLPPPPLLPLYRNLGPKVRALQDASGESMGHRASLKALADARQFVLDETGTHPDRASVVWYSAWKDLHAMW